MIMKLYRHISLILTAFSLLFGANAQNTTWEIDPSHSHIGFTIEHLSMNTVHGSFTDYHSKIITSSDDFSNAQINLTIQAKSIDTKDEKRDKHIREGKKFLYVEQYPEITFESTALKKKEGNDYKLTGKLTIRDVTRKETFDVIYKGKLTRKGSTQAVFKLTGTINRYDYNINWNQTFSKGAILGKNINIECDVLLVKKQNE